MILHLIPLGYAFLAGSTLGAILTGLIVARPLRNALHREQGLRRAAVEASMRDRDAADRAREIATRAEARWFKVLDEREDARLEAETGRNLIAELDRQLHTLDWEVARWKHPRMPNGRFLGRLEASGASGQPAEAKSRSDHVQARSSGREQAR